MRRSSAASGAVLCGLAVVVQYAFDETKSNDDNGQPFKSAETGWIARIEKVRTTNRESAVEHGLKKKIK